MPKHRSAYTSEVKMKILSAFSRATILALTMSVALAQEGRRGTVVGMDEASGSITIQQQQAETVGANSPAGPPDKFAVQDGLLFNALHVGDKVAFSSQEINGVHTITELKKE